MGNSFLDRQRTDHGQRAEKKTAKRLGARLRPASGAMEGVKGDFELPAFLCENKATINESLSLKLEWLQKISNEALHVSREPALAIQFVDGSGHPKRDGSYVLISERLFKELSQRC